jgi:hypothetical protein
MQIHTQKIKIHTGRKIHTVKIAALARRILAVCAFLRASTNGTTFADDSYRREQIFYFVKEILIMLWTILAVILILWLLGFVGSVGGNLIHLLLVVALVVFLIQLITGRRSAI